MADRINNIQEYHNRARNLQRSLGALHDSLSHSIAIPSRETSLVVPSRESAATSTMSSTNIAQTNNATTLQNDSTLQERFFPMRYHNNIPVFSHGIVPTRNALVTKSPSEFLSTISPRHLSSFSWNANGRPNGTDSSPSSMQSPSASRSNASESLSLNSDRSGVITKTSDLVGDPENTSNPPYGYLIRTQKVLCRELDQLTEHNIHLATRNNSLRKDLERVKVESRQIQQLRTHQVINQSAEYELLLSKYESLTKEFYKLQEKNNVQASKVQEKTNRSEYVESLERENTNLRKQVVSLHNNNGALLEKVKELESIIHGAGSLIHGKQDNNNKNDCSKCFKTKEMETKPDSAKFTSQNTLTVAVSKVEENDSSEKQSSFASKNTSEKVINEAVLPQALKRKASSELAHPTVNGRQVTNDMNIPYAKEGDIMEGERLLKNLSKTSQQCYKSLFHTQGRSIQDAKRSNLSLQYCRAEMDKTFAMPSKLIDFSMGSSKNKLKEFLKANVENLCDEDDQSIEENEKKILHAASSQNNDSSPIICEDEKRVEILKDPESPINVEKLGETQTLKPSTDAEKKLSMTADLQISNVDNGKDKTSIETKEKRKRGRPKRDKNEGWPKRPLSAYNLFFREHRIHLLKKLRPQYEEDDEKDDEKDSESLREDEENEMKDDEFEDGKDGKRKRGRPKNSGKKRKRATPHGIITFESLGKKISIDWKNASPAVKEKYRILATENLKKYHDELDAFLKKKGKREAIIQELKSGNRNKGQTQQIIDTEVGEVISNSVHKNDNAKSMEVNKNSFPV